MGPTIRCPRIAFNGFGRGIGKNELRNLVDQFNKNFSTAATGKRTTRDQVIPTLLLPQNFDNGDNYFSQDVRLSRLITIRENFKLTLIGEIQHSQYLEPRRLWRVA